MNITVTFIFTICLRRNSGKAKLNSLKSGPIVRYTSLSNQTTPLLSRHLNHARCPELKGSTISYSWCETKSCMDLAKYTIGADPE